MVNNMTDITLLCKVVDNFGDIGFVYRLARSLSDIFQGGACPSAQSSTFRLPPLAGDTDKSVSPATPPSGQDFQNQNSLKLRIVVDNLESFHLLCPQIDPSKDFQLANNWEIYRWSASEICHQAFKKNQPRIIIECFQCGRPEWLENLLFEEKVPDIVNIIMLDYLTAEDYAESFHKLQSLTRSARVQKVNFMPGFTGKTGGLILDQPFLLSLKNRKMSEHTAIFFSYPRDWTPAVKALQKFNIENCQNKLNVLLARGAGYQSFKDAWQKEKSEDFFTLTELPFMAQTEWDALMTRTPLLFIRGEDSLSRACLCGVPFIWHAYPQSQEYQLVKVQALLEKLRPYFLPESFSILQNCWISYNTTDIQNQTLQEHLDLFLKNYKALCQGFSDFSRDLLQNGDLTSHLLEFIKERINNA